MMSVQSVAYSSGSAVESCPCGIGDVLALSPAYCSGVNGLTVLVTVLLLFLWYSWGMWLCRRPFRGHGWAGLLAICAGFCAEGAWIGSMYDAGGLWPALGAALAWPYGVYAGFGAMKEVLE